MMRYPIPKASVAAWEAHQNKTPQNAGLIFERFVPDWADESALKKNGLESVRQAASRADRDLFTAWNARWEAMARAVRAVPFSLKTDWRLVAGLGRKGPLEVGFTFHRYGFPILPGSSVKGIARAYAILVEGLDDGHADFLEVFGYAPKDAKDSRLAQSGRAIFCDAVPAQLPKLELDIMNPHYPDYYRGEDNLGNWQSPNPVYFLTVAAGTEFRFAVGWRGVADEALRRKAEEWLRGGLMELGAGAKTSAGYGYFVSTKPPPSTVAETPTTAAQATAPSPTPPTTPTATRVLTGSIRYDGGRAFVRLDDGSGSLPVDWQALGIKDRWAGKTAVEAEIAEVGGKRRIVGLKKRSGAV